MPDCPNGTKARDSWLHKFVWATHEALRTPISWLHVLAPPLVEAILPWYVSVDELCATVPGPVPTLDWQYIFTHFAERHPGGALSTWAAAAWAQIYWDLYCECNSVTGPGPCAAIPEFGGTKTGAQNQGLKLVARVPAPASWTTYSVTRRRGADANPGPMSITYQFENAAQTGMQFTLSQLNQLLNSGATSTLNNPAIFSTANKALIRYVSLWTSPSGTGGQGLSTQYTWDSFISFTFTGTCTDVVTIPPSPTPVLPPEPVGLPPMPAPPAGCDLDDVCARLAVIQQLLANVNKTTTLHQVLGTPRAYSLGTVHAGLVTHGSFAIKQLVGLKVDLIGSHPGARLEGEPAYLWDLGWLAIGTADGMIEEVRWTRDPQIWQPARIQEATVFSWYFKGEQIANITELLPEQF